MGRKRLDTLRHLAPAPAVAIGLLYPALCGFVLLGSRVATLPATPASPTVNFVWDGNSPSLTGQDTFKDGIYANLSDTAFMQAVMTEAMAIWNNVQGSFVRLAFAQGTTATLDTSDHINSIVIQHNSNISTAAYAQPQEQFTGSGEGVIDDCDINIADTSVSADELAHTLAHELGHCLGLGHAHTNYNAIMGYSSTSTQLKLGADDKSGVIFLYPDPNYYDGKVKELICGVVGGKTAAHRGGAWVLLVLLALPLAAAGLGWRRQRG